MKCPKYVVVEVTQGERKYYEVRKKLFWSFYKYIAHFETIESAKSFMKRLQEGELPRKREVVFYEQ